MHSLKSLQLLTTKTYAVGKGRLPSLFWVLLEGSRLSYRRALHEVEPVHNLRKYLFNSFYRNRSGHPATDCYGQMPVGRLSYNNY